MLLLMLSRFSYVRLCATPEMAAHQVPPSLGFSRQEHWSGLPFASLMHESEKWKWSRSVVSDSGSSVHGIFQARVLEWGAIAISVYAEYIMKNAGVEEAPAGIKIAGRNINNLKYADDTTLMGESEEELKSLLMKVKEESEKAGLKFNT